MPEQSEERSEGVKKAIAFMLRRDKPGIAKRKPAPEPELVPELKLVIGKQVGEEGIYVGKYRPKDRGGKSLGKIFNVFAAPQDLTDDQGNKVLLQFNDAVRRVANLQDWHGHDGGNYRDDAAICNALKNESYNGEWIIPTIDLLLNNLYAHKDKGAMKGTFTTVNEKFKPNYPNRYWSSTEFSDSDHNPPGMSDVRFSDGGGYWDRKNDFRLSCRPVRLVETSATAPFRRSR